MPRQSSRAHQRRRVDIDMESGAGRVFDLSLFFPLVYSTRIFSGHTTAVGQTPLVAVAHAHARGILCLRVGTVMVGQHSSLCLSSPVHVHLSMSINTAHPAASVAASVRLICLRGSKSRTCFRDVVPLISRVSPRWGLTLTLLTLSRSRN